METRPKGHGRGVRERVYDRMKRADHHTHIFSELISVIESNNKHGGPPGTPRPPEEGTYLVKDEIEEIESLLKRDDCNLDDEDAEFAIHCLAGAFREMHSLILEAEILEKMNRKSFRKISWNGGSTLQTPLAPTYQRNQTNSTSLHF